uniref:Ovule protein n=1 Tax=Schistosoma curassoni TaxID=6186 RepID=A0A183JUZ6_9TREM
LLYFLQTTGENINCVQSALCSDGITLDSNENLRQKQHQPHSRHESPTIQTHTGYLSSSISPSSSSTLCCKSSPIKVQQSQVPLCVTVQSPYRTKQVYSSFTYDVYNDTTH